MNRKRKINLAVMAHVDAGKTTVTEEFLFHSGAKKIVGNVDKGTTTTDSFAIEKERGITIRSATVSFDWKDTKINLIDTPGHVDFIAEVERSFSVLDGAVLVISAKGGVQPQTRAIYERLKKLQIPTIFFINKIDRMGVNLEEIRIQIAEELTQNCVYLQDEYEDENYTIRIHKRLLTQDQLASQIVVYSEELYERYFEEPESITEEDYKNVLYQAVQEGMTYPVYYGSALKDMGIEELLDGIVEWLIPRENPLDCELYANEMSDLQFCEATTEELSAYVYKVEWIRKNYLKAYIRVYSGVIWFKQRVPVYDTDRTIVINMYLGLENGKETDTDFIVAGDLCVLYGSGSLHCGQWLGKPTERKGLSQELNPLLSVQVKQHEPEKRVEVLDALYELDMEDPYLHLSLKEDEITLRLFGRLQKDIIQETLMERYQMQLDFDDVKTVKKEWPKEKVTSSIWMWEPFDGDMQRLYRMKFNKYVAGIELQLEPLPKGSGLVYESQVSLGDLEKSFQNAVEEGVMTALLEGQQYEVIDTKVTFTDMEYSSVGSTPADYRILAGMVVAKALLRVGAYIIEPYMTYKARVPLGFEKYIMAKLLEVHAVVMNSEFTASEAIYSGEVSLDAVKDLALDIKMYTEGKGSFELEFLEYR